MARYSHQVVVLGTHFLQMAEETMITRTARWDSLDQCL